MKKVISRYIVAYVFFILIGFISLYIAARIPTDAIREKSVESSKILTEQTEKVRFNFLEKELYADNSSDAIMLNIIYSMDYNNPLESIMLCRRNYIPNYTTEYLADVNGNLPFENGHFSMVEEYHNLLEGKKQISYEYGRYWHGYIPIIKVLLLNFNITQIRNIIFGVVVFLLIILLILIYRNVGFMQAVAVLFAFIAADLVVWNKELHGIFPMLVGLFTSVLIASGLITKKNINLMLFINGGLVAFYDLLTTPLVGFLMPIVIYYLVNNEDKKWYIMIRDLAINGINCLLGYFAIWITKWFLTDVLFGTDIMGVSIEQIFYRTGIQRADDKMKAISKALKLNYDKAVGTATYALVTFGCIAGIINTIKYGDKFFVDVKKIPYYICLVLPVIWIMLVVNHSTIHHFFTYKNVIIMELSFLLITCDNKQKVKEEKTVYKIDEKEEK